MVGLILLTFDGLIVFMVFAREILLKGSVKSSESSVGIFVGIVSYRIVSYRFVSFVDIFPCKRC